MSDQPRSGSTSGATGQSNSEGIGRRTFIMTGSAATFSVGLAGCSGDGDGDQNTEGSTDGEGTGDGTGGTTDTDTGSGDAEEILWLSSTESTGAYQATSGLASVLNQQQEQYEINAPPGGAGPQGMVRMAQGEADFAYTNTAVAYEQDNQEGDWENFPDTDLRQMWHFYDIHFNIAAPADSDIKSAADLPGNRLSLGSTDGTAMQIMPPVLEKGITVDDVEIAPISWDQLGDALNSGRVDAVVALLTNSEFPSYTEQIFAQNDARYLDWPESIRTGVDEDSTYNGQYYSVEDLDGEDAGFDGREQVWFQDSVYHMYTTADRDEDVVYDLMSMMWEHVDEIGDYHALNAYWSDEDFISQKFHEDIGLHPGAERFFEEQGIDVSYL